MPEAKKSTRKPQTSAPQTDEYGHVQPQALELERVVLGALMIEQNAFFQTGNILRPESFYEPRHRELFAAIQALHRENQAVDILTVIEKLKLLGKLEEAGGHYYVTKLSSNVTSSAHIESHAKFIAQKALARDLITYTSSIQTKAFDETQDVEELMQEAEGKLFELSQHNMQKDYKQIDPVIEEAFDLLKKAAASDGGLSGVASGYHGLDKITNGWQNSDLIILAARPAMGKTAFALSMLKNITVDNRLAAAFFSLEMSNVQLIQRLMSNVCGITGDKLRSGQLARYEWGQLDSKINDLKGAPLYIDDTPSMSVFELRTKARRMVREHKVNVIVIDYLQLMNASGMSSGNRQEEVSIISRSLKGLAKELNIPVIALSQLNRGLASREGNEGKRPQLTDLRESGAIEQDADIVCFIHRPEYYRIFEDEKGRDLRGKAEIIVAKHRNGSVGDVLLNFQGQFARFQNEEDMMAHAMVDGEGARMSDISPDADFSISDGSSPFPPAGANDVPF